MSNTGLQSHPKSHVVSFFLQKRYLRVLGQRIFPTYSVILPGGATLYLRSRFGFDAATVGEVVYKRIYERVFTLDPRDTVIDVGAHIGSFTVVAAGEVGPDGNVISLEPSVQNFRMLEKNIRTNQLANVLPLNLAAGSAEGVGELRLYNRPGGNSFYSRDFTMVGYESVKVATLDSISERFKLEKVNFVKIDVEGHELEVLKGAAKILGEYKPKLAIETHEFGPSVQELTEYLDGFNYSAKQVPYGPHQGLLYAS